MTNINYDPEKELQEAINYYEKFVVNKKTHNWYKITKIKSEFLIMDNPFSMDDEAFCNYPNHGLLEYDYMAMLSLNPDEPEDMEQFRILAANFARVLYEQPKAFEMFKNLPHFYDLIGMVAVEGIYEYFCVDMEKFLLRCVEHDSLSAGDCGAISMAKTYFNKQWNETSSLPKKMFFKAIQTLYKRNNKEIFSNIPVPDITPTVNQSINNSIPSTINNNTIDNNTIDNNIDLESDLDDDDHHITNTTNTEQIIIEPISSKPLVLIENTLSSNTTNNTTTNENK